jgi:hypothetical protein
MLSTKNSCVDPNILFWECTVKYSAAPKHEIQISEKETDKKTAARRRRSL